MSKILKFENIRLQEMKKRYLSGTTKYKYIIYLYDSNYRQILHEIHVKLYYSGEIIFEKIVNDIKYFEERYNENLNLKLVLQSETSKEQHYWYSIQKDDFFKKNSII